MELFDVGLDAAALQLAGRPFTGGQTGNEGLVAFQALLIQAPKFHDGLGMVVHPQIQCAVVFGGENLQGSCLFTTFVAAGSFSGGQRAQQTLGKRQGGMLQVSLGRGVDDLWPRKHIARYREPVTGQMPAPVDAGCARKRCGTIARVNQVQLAVFAPGIGCSQVGNDGKIWVLRGLAGHPEDTNRYAGLMQALEGTNIQIVAEQNGDWQYDTGKKVCETLYLADPNVDGIWSSGADMTRACVDVFKAFGAPIPPISGEGNNGFFGQWTTEGYESVSAEYSPSQGAAGVRAAVALLEGKEIFKHYDYNPAGWDRDKAAEFYRADLSANVWWPSELPEEKLIELYGN